MKKSKGLIILLHGWEGSSSSAYILAAGDYFYNLNFSILPFEFTGSRDSHHLNEGLFMAPYWKNIRAVNYLSQHSKNLPHISV